MARDQERKSVFLSDFRFTLRSLPAIELLQEALVNCVPRPINVELVRAILKKSDSALDKRVPVFCEEPLANRRDYFFSLP